MFPINIGVREFGLNAAKLQSDIFVMAARLGSLKEPLTESVHKVVIPSISMNFLLEGRPAWAPLSLDRIERRGSAHPILIDSHKLIKAALSKTIWRITNNEANMEAINTRVKYAKYHQEGTRNMPQRQFAILQGRDIDNIVEIFNRWIGNATMRYGNWPSI